MLAFNQAPSEVETWPTDKALKRFDFAMKKLEG
jgi:hypothetical protein